MESNYQKLALWIPSLKNGRKRERLKQKKNLIYLPTKLHKWMMKFSGIIEYVICNYIGFCVIKMHLLFYLAHCSVVTIPVTNRSTLLFKGEGVHVCQFFVSKQMKDFSANENESFRIYQVKSDEGNDTRLMQYVN